MPQSNTAPRLMMDRRILIGSVGLCPDTAYHWGSHHWKLTTWNKVHIIKAVYEFGVNVIHSDTDVVWFGDPLPFFQQQLQERHGGDGGDDGIGHKVRAKWDAAASEVGAAGATPAAADAAAAGSSGWWAPPHVAVATDSVSTMNRRGDRGLEDSPQPYAPINTGIYFLRQWSGGAAFLDEWLSWQERDVGHDQDGFNTLARGFFFHRDPDLRLPVFPDAHTRITLPRGSTSGSGTNDGSERDVGGVGDGNTTGEWAAPRTFRAAYSNTTGVSFLPASMFGNTYTYVNARLWEKLKHPLYAIHWVWGGSTLESKRQNMRDAMKFHDEPDYYTSPNLVTFDLDLLPVPPTFNSWFSTEHMIRFHVQAANYQLQQAYYAFAIALIANRTLVMPRFQCYCSKNWYQTQQCRINFEKATTFPFTCALSHVLRVKKLEAGFRLPDNTEYSGHRVFIREYSFLDNPKVPDSLKKSFVEIVPSQMPRAANLGADELVVSVEPAPRGYGQRVTVAAPLVDRELRQVLGRFKGVRVLHFPQPARTLSGFSTYATWEQYDAEIQKHVAYWCCRAPGDMRVGLLLLWSGGKT
eukprot:XP_001697686.1 predicted protein [Chlamydomonas reinhardtii]